MPGMARFARSSLANFRPRLRRVRDTLRAKIGFGVGGDHEEARRGSIAAALSVFRKCHCTNNQRDARRHGIGRDWRVDSRCIDYGDEYSDGNCDNPRQQRNGGLPIRFAPDRHL